MSLTADLSRRAEPARPTIYRHYVLAALLAITLVNYVQRNATGPATTTIMDDFGALDPNAVCAGEPWMLIDRFIPPVRGTRCSWDSGRGACASLPY